MHLEYKAAQIYSKLCRLSPFFNKWTMKAAYQAMAAYSRKTDWTFMNYGYTSLDPNARNIDLVQPEDQERYCIQLYQHVAESVDLTGRSLLDVGCGRGGGTWYYRHHGQAARVVGLDFSARNVVFCRNRYQAAGLTFIKGDAEQLPFAASSFEFVVSVESSHCYRSMETFLGEVRRVLRPAGLLLLADFRERERIGLLDQQLAHSGIVMVEETDITANVLRALELDSQRRAEQIRRSAPSLLAGLLGEFAGVTGSDIYERFRSRATLYKRFVLRKSGG